MATNADKKERMKELWGNQQLKQNLVCSCVYWLLGSFNFFLITFYLKRFPGSIYTNSMCYAFADITAFLCSGGVLKFFTIQQGLCFSYSVSVAAGVAYLVFWDAEASWVIPAIVWFCRVGGAMSFNIGYVSVGKLFPPKYVSSVFGVVNMVSHFITVAAPLTAELKDPFPFLIFTANAGLAIFATFGLVELDRAKKTKVGVAKKRKMIEERER